VRHAARHTGSEWSGRRGSVATLAGGAVRHCRDGHAVTLNRHGEHSRMLQCVMRYRLASQEVPETNSHLEGPPKPLLTTGRARHGASLIDATLYVMSVAYPASCLDRPEASPRLPAMRLRGAQAGTRSPGRVRQRLSFLAALSRHVYRNGSHARYCRRRPSIRRRPRPPCLALLRHRYARSATWSEAALAQRQRNTRRTSHLDAAPLLSDFPRRNTPGGTLRSSPTSTATSSPCGRAGCVRLVRSKGRADVPRRHHSSSSERSPPPKNC
jgi:hypothetical protein